MSHCEAAYPLAQKYKLIGNKHSNLFYSKLQKFFNIGVARERERERDRERDRQTDTYRERETDRQTDTYRERERERLLGYIFISSLLQKLN
jgi:hypothetical protein